MGSTASSVLSLQVKLMVQPVSSMVRLFPVSQMPAPLKVSKARPMM